MKEVAWGRFVEDVTQSLPFNRSAYLNLFKSFGLSLRKSSPPLLASFFFLFRSWLLMIFLHYCFTSLFVALIFEREKWGITISRKHLTAEYLLISSEIRNHSKTIGNSRESKMARKDHSRFSIPFVFIRRPFIARKGFANTAKFWLT